MRSLEAPQVLQSVIATRLLMVCLYIEFMLRILASWELKRFLIVGKAAEIFIATCHRCLHIKHWVSRLICSISFSVLL